jgi:hypothetical protein
MLKWLKSHWLELVVFGAIAIGYVICCAPNYTWVNTDCDGAHYTYAAKWLFPAHKTSAPLYLLSGHLMLYLPLGTDFWRMAMLSVIASVVACIFVYGIVKHYTSNRMASLIAAVIYGGSALAISQGTIVETYAITTMLALGAYYYAIQHRFLLTALFIGAGMAIHPIMAFTAGVIFFSFRGFRKWKYISVVMLFALLYLYVPITNRPPYMWQPEHGNFISGFVKDTWNTITMLTGQVSMWDLPKRIIDTGLIILACLGLGTFTALFALKKLNWLKEPLFWLAVLPIAYFMTDLAPQTYVYALPGIAFGACLAGIGLAKLNKKWVTIFVGVTACTLALFNFNYFDIGRTLDPNLEATKFYKELDSVPNGTILLCQQGWEWTMVFVHNQYTHSNVTAICVGNLASQVYRNQMQADYGVNVFQGKYRADNGVLTLYTGNDLSQVDSNMVMDMAYNYIILNNNNVLVTKGKDIRNYGAEITQPEIIQLSTSHITPAWRFDPSNPYDFITGAIEISQWSNIIMSNHNVIMLLMVGTIGYGVIDITKFIFKKPKWKWSKKHELKQV